MKSAKQQIFTQGVIAVAVSLLFQAQPVLANPTGAQVVNGTVSMARPNAATLNVTNSPGAIINWQGFSIGAGQDIRFGSSGIMTLTAGAGNNANALVQSSTTQNIDRSSLTLLGGGAAGATATAQIDPLQQFIVANGVVTVQGGSGMNALAQITSQGTQNLLATNGNVNVTGGTGVGSTALITAAGVQSISPQATLTPNVGGATVTGLAASSSTTSSSPGSPAGTVLALGDTQIGIIAETEPRSSE